MKYIYSLVILLLLTNTSIAAEPAKIVVVDMQKLIDNSTAASGIKEQAKKERDKYQTSIAKEEEALRKEEAKLAEQRTLLTTEAFSEKRRQFNDKLTKVQREFQEKRVAQDASLKKSLDQVNQVIFEIIDALSKEENFDIAIPTAQILFYGKTLDITDKVLERLNKKLPKVVSAKAEETSSEPEKKSEPAKNTKKK